ncbi:MAG: 23S ribosomal RNA methyltransferase Erm [Actinomycetota bacterium]|nr:23S ribosomal RNA methyltransferase Erm [Actinomycetota bacterium]
MGTRESRPGRGPRPPGQHFLRTSELAQELVTRARIAPHELVLEIGAGTGILTRELALRSRRVIAVEVDPSLSARLRRELHRCHNVDVDEADALKYELPVEPFRAFGNIPFNITTQLLHRLLDRPSPMTRADLIVQWEVARKRTARPPGNLLNILWGPWWRFDIARRIPAHCFRPVPRVDAAMLSIVRRDPPLLSSEERCRFERILRRAFSPSNGPLRREMRNWLSPLEFKRLARELGFDARARATDLGVEQWIGLYRYVDACARR